MIIKKLLLLLCIWAIYFTHVQAEYQPWVEKQLQFTHQMDELNITQSKIEELVDKQHVFYDQVLEIILLKKTDFLNKPKNFDKEIFTLEKMIRINKRRGHKYAVLRDEVQIKSYRVIHSQNKMVRKIFQALDYYGIDDFEVKMNDLFAKNQIELHTLEDVNYRSYLKMTKQDRTLKEAQLKIKDFYALMEINTNILKYFTASDKKVYRLNKYAKYNVLSTVLYINKSPLAKSINPWLNPLGLDVVKLLFIALVSLIIYFIRKVLYGVIERLLLKTRYLKKYTEDILEDIRGPITYLLLIVNIELALYIYYDFSIFEMMSKTFNIIYAFYFTFILYRIVNIVARIKIEHMGQSDKKIKDEMINVTIKVINFLIIIFGLLLVLYLAGVDLTAVLSGLGIGGFAVALAARESLANFFGTLSILMSDVFSQGDWIVADGKEGTVVEIGLRVTTLRTFDNALIAIPNGVLANKDVKNWNRRTIGRRIKMKLGVKYNSKSEDMNNAVQAIREMLKEHTGIATEKTSYSRRLHKSAKLVSEQDALGVKRTLLVYLDEFSDSSINILVYCFTKTTVWNEWLKVKEDVMYEVMKILEENDLEFAFPSLSIYQEEEEQMS